MDLPGSVGRPSRQSLRALRKQKWYRAGGSTGQRGHEPSALSDRPPGLLDHGQLFCSSRQKAADRFRSKWPNAILVHTPIHASWLNQIEIYLSIVQRKVLTPNDFRSLAQLEERLLAFQTHYERSASPFRWTFTRKDLHALLAKLERKSLALAA